MAFIEDEKVPGEMRRSVGRPRSSMKLLEDIFLSQIMVRRDDPAERTPRICVKAEAFSEVISFLTVHEVELKRKTLPHFVAPLETERRRRKNQNASDATPKQELAEDQTCFDRLTSADIVGDEKIVARLTKGLEERNELLIFDLDRAMEGAGYGKTVERSCAVRIKERHGGRPAGGPEERVIIFSGHGIGGRKTRQVVRLEQDFVSFELPEKTFTDRKLIVLVLNMDEVKAARRTVHRRDLRYDAASIAHDSEHPDAGDLI